MTATCIPRTYEKLISDQQLKEFAVSAGWLKENQQLAIIPDENGTPVILQAGQPAKTPEDWEEGTPIDHLLGDNIKETQEILSNLNFRLYQF